jgi:hypothetical protein
MRNTVDVKVKMNFGGPPKTEKVAVISTAPVRAAMRERIALLSIIFRIPV